MLHAVLQIHYDLHWSANVAATHELDSSGVRMYLSDELQPQEMGVIRFGPSTSAVAARTPRGLLPTWILIPSRGLTCRPLFSFCVCALPRAGVKTKNIVLPPGERNITIAGSCPASETQGLPFPLSVFAQAHHMHLLGSYFKLERVRTCLGGPSGARCPAPY